MLYTPLTKGETFFFAFQDELDHFTHKIKSNTSNDVKKVS